MVERENIGQVILPRPQVCCAGGRSTGIYMTLSSCRRKTPDPCLYHRGRAEGSLEVGGDTYMSRVGLGWLSVISQSPPRLLPHSYSHSLLVSVILLPQVLCTCPFFLINK